MNENLLSLAAQMINKNLLRNVLIETSRKVRFSIDIVPTEIIGEVFFLDVGVGQGRTVGLE